MANWSNRDNEHLPLAENIRNRRRRNHCFAGAWGKGDLIQSVVRAEAALPTTVRVRGAFLSRLCFDHDSSQAPPDMIATPEMPTRTCRTMPAESSVSTKYPVNPRATPRQNISSEFCPQRIIGHNQREVRIGDPAGTKRTAITASATKCANLRISRSALLIG